MAVRKSMERQSGAPGAKLHIGIDADTGEIVASDLTDKGC